MSIIDLMAVLMGVGMGFLAFLMIGGISGVSSWIFYPGSSRGAGFGKTLIALMLGFLAAAVSSYLGQFWGVFQSGQILEWFSSICAACAVGGIYAALAK